MGTRSLATIMEDGKKLTTIYRQYDGYPEGMGLDIAKFLSGKEVVNGFGKDTGLQFNGMGCLAAQLIKELKQGIGNVYIYPADANDCWEEYHYFISNKSGLNIKCIEVYNNKTIFDGTPQDFIKAYNNK